MASSTQRLWIINSEQPDLDDAVVSSLAERLTDHQILKYRTAAARRRTLLSHLLQRHACCAMAKLRPDQVQIKRTQGGKPFAAVAPPSHCPNFNFNAAHDGELVALAASTHYLTGVDVHKTVPPSEDLDYLTNLLTAAQRSQAEAMSSEEQRIWPQALFSTKEAYTKAIGVGLGQDFSQIEFEPALPSAWAAPPVMGESRRWRGRVHHLPEQNSYEMPGPRAESDQGVWCLELQWIDPTHMLVTATGDVARAVDADGEFKSRLTRPGLCPSSVEEGSCGVSRPMRLFELLNPTELENCDLTPAGFGLSEVRSESRRSSDSNYSDEDSLEEACEEDIFFACK